MTRFNQKDKKRPGDPTDICKQYLDLKAQYPDMILLFRLGDFYETFDSDAYIVAQELDLVLTGREMYFQSKERMPMAGLPYHAAENYIARLIAKGYKVAVAEQMGAPGKEMIDRKITRVITPGTVVEPGMLAEKRNNYLAAALIDGNQAGLAYVDITTGEFQTTQFANDDNSLRLRQELDRVGPAELIVPAAVPRRKANLVTKAKLRQWAAEANDGHIPASADKMPLITPPADISPAPTTPFPLEDFALQNASNALFAHFAVQTLDGFGCANLPLAIRAAGALIAYLRETNPVALEQLHRLSTYSVEGYMTLDPQTRRNLELADRHGERAMSLLSVLDRTKTGMGGRMLNRWLSQPLIDLPRLRARLDAVSLLVEQRQRRERLRELLNGMADIERVANRITQRIALPRDLVSLAHTLKRVREVKELFAPTPDMNKREAIFAALVQRLNDCGDVCDLVSRAILLDPENNNQPVAVLGKGKAIAPGFDPDYDEKQNLKLNARQLLDQMAQMERERSGIKNLKIDSNAVFGYYIAISRVHGDKPLPADYVRKQTMANEERYITPALKDLELQINNAEATIVDLERAAYDRVLTAISEQAEALLRTADALAHFDVFAALADVAVRNNYVAPTLDDGEAIAIVGGRHPVVEQALQGEPFVPNDTHIACADEQLLLITGPNMAGKSVYLRQVAIITLMAQIGSWVPATSAHIGLVDRIFTRVGAQDDIATGQSTFMVEMVETANILNHATRKSLIILDEIGRGTSTYDGLAIARAVVEYIHNSPRLGAKTMFATHYHELTEMEAILPHVRNYNVAVAEQGDHIIFLRQVVRGGADRSYGIHVAEMAGLPRSVLRRATEVLGELERSGQKQDRRAAMTASDPRNQMAMFGAVGGNVISPPTSFAPPAPSPVVEELKSLRVDELSPIEALSKLYELQKKAREDEV